jgi:hypothetical protein
MILNIVNYSLRSVGAIHTDISGFLTSLHPIKADGSAAVPAKAFSSEVKAGSREENTSTQESRAGSDSIGTAQL